MQCIEKNGYLLYMDDGTEISEEEFGACRRVGAAFFTPKAFCVAYERVFAQGRLQISDRGGVPIPMGCFAIRPGFIDADKMPSDASLACVRTALELAQRGVFAYRGDDVLPPLDMYGRQVADLPSAKCWRSPRVDSPQIAAEIARWSGPLRYLNSQYVEQRCAMKKISFRFHDKAAFRPLLVSGALSWGTKAVYWGYFNALKEMGVDVHGFEYDEHRKYLSQDVTAKLLLGELACALNRYTHMIAIDGLSIPPWLLASCRQKTVLISTEDPYASNATRRLYPCFDYPFSNDRSMAEAFGIPYLPVAADHVDIGKVMTPGAILRKPVDILFLGALLPDRIRLLKDLREMCLRHEWKLRIIGPVHDRENLGSLVDVVEERVVSTQETLAIQSTAKVCLNLFRDPGCAKTGANNELMVRPWSVNPRCYDVPLCGSVLLSDPRMELLQLFGEGAAFLNMAELEDKLENLLGDPERWKETQEQQEKLVRNRNLYLHRCLRMLSVLKEGFVAEAP